jgi:hypothetical protein
MQMALATWNVLARIRLASEPKWRVLREARVAVSNWFAWATIETE